MAPKKTTPKKSLPELPAGDGDSVTEALGLLHEFNIDVVCSELWLTPVKFNDPHELGVELEMAIQFTKNIRYLNTLASPPKNLIIHMSSPGGDWTACLAIYDAIRLSEIPTILIVYGEASSASGIIMQAADLRLMLPSTTLMIHDGEHGFYGHPRSCKSRQSWMETQVDLMVDMFVERSTTTREIIKARIESDIDWYISAKQAVTLGFADGILGSAEFPSISKLKEYDVQRVGTNRT